MDPVRGVSCRRSWVTAWKSWASWFEFSSSRAVIRASVAGTVQSAGVGSGMVTRPTATMRLPRTPTHTR